MVTEPGGQILLIRRAIEPAYGLWTFPGGYMDLGETTASAAAREVFEETSVSVRVTGLLGVYSYLGDGVVVVVHRAEAERTEPVPCPECLEAVWQAPEQLPWGQLAFQSTRDAFSEFLDSGYKNS